MLRYSQRIQNKFAYIADKTVLTQSISVASTDDHVAPVDGHVADLQPRVSRPQTLWINKDTKPSLKPSNPRWITIKCCYT